jgi:hypothetical protein
MKLAAAVAALALVLCAGAQGSAQDDVTLIDRGLSAAAENGLMFFEDAAADLAIAKRAAEVANRLPADREANLRAVLHEVASHSSGYDAPRATALFAMLDENTQYFASHAVPKAKTDVVGPDGVVYRFFPGLGLQWHPLAEFGALNAAVASRNLDRTARLAQALVEREEDNGYQYYFRFGGPTPWTSGMAEAVAAQSLARAAVLTGNPFLTEAATRAARRAGRLVLRLSAGPWIRLYSFDREVVLNAQLQAVLSLQDYAQLAGDASARGLADALSASAQALLPRFDTGAWSLYSLGGSEAPLEYQRYVTLELRQLAARDKAWSEAAARFVRYLREPPALTVSKDTPFAWPRPRDGYLDTIAVSFRLSKISRVALIVGSQRTIATVARGAHTLLLDPGTLQPGQYNARLGATDLAGNFGTVQLEPVTVGWDLGPPNIDASLDGTRLTWFSDDLGTPWLWLRVVLRRSGEDERVRDLGHRPRNGSFVLARPVGTWDATLRATNSAGYTVTVPLGAFPGSG